MAYTPPAYNAVNFNFQYSYTPPAYNAVNFDWQPVILPTGWDDSAFGTAQLNRTVVLTGFAAGAIGTLSIYNNVQIASLQGYGLGPESYGTAQLNRTLPLSAGWDSSAFGLPQINDIQVGAGFSSNAYGTASVKGQNTVSPSGYSDEAFGTDSIAHAASTQTAAPSGFSDEAFGTAYLSRTLPIGSHGIAPGSFGTTEIDYTQHIVAPAGWLTGVQVAGVEATRFGFAGYGTGFIDYGVRSRTPAGIPPGAFGTTKVTFSTQTVDQAGNSIRPVGFGTAFISYAVRYLYPAGITHGAFGRHLVDFTPIVCSPSGWDDTVFGATTVHDNTQDVNHLGMKDEAFGLPFVALNPQPVAPLGIQDFNTSPALVYNLKQIIYPYFDPLSSETEHVVDPYVLTTIENRNRSIGPEGFIGRIGTHSIANAAVPLAPEGDDMISWGPATFIDFAIRSFTVPDPLDPIVGQFGQWTVVWKYPELHPTGWNDASYGTPSIINLNRNLPTQGFGDGTVGGGATFIDYAIRSLRVPLGPEGFYGMPDVQNHTRYISPNGFTPTFVFGGPEVQIHWNIIYGHGIPSAEVVSNEARIWRSTPEIDPASYDLSLYGNTAIHNQFEYKAVQGFTNTFWGRTDISYRTKYLSPPGINAIRWGPLTKIYNDTPDPPGQQYILPTGFAGTIGDAVVRRNEIDCAGFDDTHWGMPNVILMGAEVRKFGGETFGQTALIGPQYVTVPSTPPVPQVDDVFGGVRIDPFTIWCTNDFPPGDPSGNPGAAWREVDFDVDQRQSLLLWDLFGPVHVTNQFRNLYPQGWDDAHLGSVSIDTRPQYIAPEGIAPKRILGPGLNYPQTIDLGTFSDGIPSEEGFGAAVVDWAPPYTKYIRCTEFLAQVGPVKAQSVDYFNRTISPSGWDSSLVLYPRRVGPPIPMNAGCGDQITFGTAYISHSPLIEPMDGWEEFSTDWTDFAGRMRVTESQFDGIAPHGFDSSQFGAPGINVGGAESPAIYMDVLFDV